MAKIIIDGIIGWDVEGWQVRNQLERAGGEDITVEISSPGGYVMDGLEIFNLLKNYEGNVKTHIIGLAASMASYIALAGDEITAESNSIFMIHNASAVSIGDHRDMVRVANHLEAITGLLSRVYVQKTGKSIDDIRNLMDEETYFYGDEIKDAGFADKMIGESDKKKKKQEAALAHLAVNNCSDKMKKRKDKKDDLEKAAAMIKSDNTSLSELESGENNEVLDGLHNENESHDIENGRSGLIQNKTHVDTLRKSLDNQNDDCYNHRDDSLNIPTGVGINNNRRVSMELTNLTMEEIKSSNPTLYDQIYNMGVENERKRVKAHLTLGKKTKAIDYMHDCIANGKSIQDEDVMAEYVSVGLNRQDAQDRADDNVDDVSTPDAELDEETEVKSLTDAIMKKSKRGGE